jgi:hypothetical protein
MKIMQMMKDFTNNKLGNSLISSNMTIHFLSWHMYLSLISSILDPK